MFPPFDGNFFCSLMRGGFMIIVDGRNSGKEISNFANLEEILVDVMEDEGMELSLIHI